MGLGHNGFNYNARKGGQGEFLFCVNLKQCGCLKKNSNCHWFFLDSVSLLWDFKPCRLAVCVYVCWSSPEKNLVT